MNWQGKTAFITGGVSGIGFGIACAFAEAGIVLRGIGDPRGHLAIRLGVDTLDFAVGIGPCAMSAVGGIGMLRLPESLPETLLLSMPGRRLGQVVDHSIFRDRDIRIRDVMTHPGSQLPVLCFRPELAHQVGRACVL